MLVCHCPMSRRWLSTPPRGAQSGWLLRVCNTCTIGIKILYLEVVVSFHDNYHLIWYNLHMTCFSPETGIVKPFWMKVKRLNKKESGVVKTWVPWNSKFIQQICHFIRFLPSQGNPFLTTFTGSVERSPKSDSLHTLFCNHKSETGFCKTFEHFWKISSSCPRVQLLTTPCLLNFANVLLYTCDDLLKYMYQCHNIYTL